MSISNEVLPRTTRNAGESPTWLATRLAFFETYSLDVAAGIVGAAVFLQTFSDAAAAPWNAFFCLGCAALAVYNLDHLLDILGSTRSQSPRRLRHRERARSMAILVVLATMAGSTSALWLPGRIQVGGMFLVLYMGAYFAGVVVGVRGIPKRLGAAIGWAAAAALPTIGTCANPMDPRLLAAFAVLAGTAWVNLQSYATADGAGEGRNTDAPGTPLRVAAAAGVAILLVAAMSLDPSPPGPWLALAATGILQAILPALPVNLVHPVGEWGFALLAFVRLGR